VAELRIGCSGFLYDHWKGTFYPNDLPKRQWLRYYTERFSTVELNVTFYRLPEKETFVKWYLGTPDTFLFSLKGSRFITHVKKLKDCAEPIETFFSRALMLKEKLAVVLWQFPPTFKVNAERFSEFLASLKPFGIRNTFEFRNQTWINKEIASIASKAGVSLCMADHPDFLAKLPATSDFIYIRRHGVSGVYEGSYTKEALQKDAKAIQGYLNRNKNVFIYFNNDIGGNAPRNASELISLSA
jgi:uncharacterized protein YecE (DUF72 family)